MNLYRRVYLLVFFFISFTLPLVLTPILVNAGINYSDKEPNAADRRIDKIINTFDLHNANVTHGDGLENPPSTSANAQNVEFVSQIGGPYPAEAVTVAGNYAYIAGRSGGLRIINITDPTAPKEVGFYDTPGYANGVAIAGNFAYVADEDSGLRIINITDPTAPKGAGFYDTPGYAMDVVVSGSYAYVADHSSGLRIINITDPTAPKEAGFYDTPGYAQGVTVVGNYAYVADDNRGLRIINITDPTAPKEAGFYEVISEDVMAVAVAGSYAYIIDWGGMLRIINITDPTAPKEAGFYNIRPTGGEDFVDVDVAGSYAYVVDVVRGLHVINVTDPAAPTEAGFYDTPGASEGVVVSGNYTYVADWWDGLLVLRFTGDMPPITAASFLEFPIDYTDSNFATVAGLFQIEGGLVKTRVDHERAASSYMAFDGVLRTGFESDACRTSEFNACYDQADAPDIAVDRRSPVLAAFDGKVVGLKSDCVEGTGNENCGSGFGNYVWLDHANCYRTRYSHLQTISVSFGQEVVTGVPVGLSGNTGNSGGPHLDFQVRFDPNCTDGTWTGGAGVIVDPYGWIPFDPNQSDPLSTNTEYLWKHPISSKTSVGSSGGSASNTNNSFVVIVPDGGLSEPATVEAGSGHYPAYPDSGWFSIGAGYWFRILEWFNPLRSSLEASQFNIPAEVQIIYEEASLAHMDESTATIHQWDDANSSWLPLNTTLDANNNLATTETLTHGIFNLQAQILCGDSSEPNDEWSAAYVLENNFVGSLDSSNDEDWYVVELAAGESTTASSHALGDGVNSKLELYVNGDVYVDSDDSTLVFSAPVDQSRTFYLRVVPDPISSIGCSASYTLALAPNEGYQIYLPTIIR